MLSTQQKKEMCNKLNTLLANEFVLYTKTLKYHWNLEGNLFHPLHLFFDGQYRELQEVVDTIAERIRALQEKSFGTLQEFSTHATITEDPGTYPSQEQMIRNLLTGYETIIEQVRSIIDYSTEINDMGTNNLLAGLLEKHEKTAWMLRAHLQ